jgi:AraC-like DNA-binding protein
MESSFISRSSKIAADPLSDVLALLNPRGYMSGGIDAGGDWSIGFERDAYFRCFAIVSGQCWLGVEGLADAVHLQEGEFVVLPHGRAFRLASDLTVAPVDIMTVIAAPMNGSVLCWQGGGACLALSALFTFAGNDADILLSVLPPLVHIREDPDRVAMRWYLERMMKVIREPQPGGVLLGEHLAQMMLIEVLGLSMRETPTGGAGWLSALADKQIGAAITAMHQHPGYRWTLQGLAERVGMSRSAFAIRFKKKVGRSAMAYLTHWRMRRAGHQLVNSSEPVSSIAFSLGYASESAFGFAFKREMGCSPRQYGEARTAVSDTSETTAPEKRQGSRG